MLLRIIHTGPTTVFFWAPTFKWGLVIAGIGDLKRPPDTISLSQTASLMVTGAIWSRYNVVLAPNKLHVAVTFTIQSNPHGIRYSLVITPKNYNLFSVNLFTCGTGMYNFIRGALYHMDEGK